MKLAYICSPCRGDYEKNIIKAQEYCREAMTLRKHAVSAAAAYADQPAAAPLLAEAGKSLREVTAVHINIDPTEASELGEMIANSLKNGTSMLRGGA